MTSTLDLYGEGLLGALHGRPSTSVLRTDDDRCLTLDLPRWVAPASGADDGLLARCSGGTLDIGCGPGRLTRALQQRGIPCLGIDVSPVAVELASRGGVPVLHASVFGNALTQRAWDTVLLADGNIGIGGDAVALLSRCHDLLVPGGKALVELEPPCTPTRNVRVRLESTDGRTGSWFPWVHAGIDDAARLAHAAGFWVSARWSADARWFVELRRI